MLPTMTKVLLFSGFISKAIHVHAFCNAPWSRCATGSILSKMRAAGRGLSGLSGLPQDVAGELESRLHGPSVNDCDRKSLGKVFVLYGWLYIMVIPLICTVLITCGTFIINRSVSHWGSFPDVCCMINTDNKIQLKCP